MAVKLAEFYHRYRNESLGIIMLTQVFTASIAGVVAWVLWQFVGLNSLSAFTYSLVALIGLQVAAAPVLLGFFSRPLRVVWQAVMRVGDDSTQVEPPQLNATQDAKSGLRDFVQAIYDLAAAPAAGSKPTTATADLARATLDALPVGVVVLDDRTNVTYANAAAPAHPDSDNKIAIELNFDQTDSLDAWLASCQDKLRDTHSWRRVANRMPGEEGRRIFDVVGSYRKGQGTILAIIDHTADYTPEEEDMDFIALAAHELRGPITVIRGYLELLAQEIPGLNADQQQLIDRLEVSSEQLSGYVNNILNVSRYDRNHLTLHLQEMRLADIIAPILPDLNLRASTQHRSVTFRIPADLPTIAADSSSLSEVISNLVDNAIKYSHGGGEVVVGAAVRDGMVEVTVQDSGIGMPESVMGSLFTKFYRSHRSRQTVSGTGLGLYICKAIISSHGGSIWARSVEGKGSTFGFTVPIYRTVAGKLETGNQRIIAQAEGWIKNHAMYRR